MQQSLTEASALSPGRSSTSAAAVAMIARSAEADDVQLGLQSPTLTIPAGGAVQLGLQSPTSTIPAGGAVQAAVRSLSMGLGQQQQFAVSQTATPASASPHHVPDGVATTTSPTPTREAESKDRAPEQQPASVVRLAFNIVAPEQQQPSIVGLAFNIVAPEQQQPSVVRLAFNIVAPEPPLLPPGMSAELARQRAEAEALEEAEKELRGLEAHKKKLQDQVQA